MSHPEDPMEARAWQIEQAADYADEGRVPDPTVHDIRCQACGCTVRLRIQGLGVWFGECRVCNIGYCAAGRLTAGRAT
jgi:hypothetical protein